MEEVVEEIEAASSSRDPHSQSLMGFVYGTGMMREKSKSKSFLRHNFAAEGVALVFEGGGERRAEVYGTNFFSSCSHIMFICISIFVTCSIKFEIFRHKVKCNKHCFSRSPPLPLEFMGISLLLLDEQQQLDLPSVSSLTLFSKHTSSMQLWRCCSGGLSRVDMMEGRKKKSSYQLENFTRSLPTPVKRQKKLIFSVRLRLCELSSKMACRLYLAQVATGSSQNLSGATDVFLLTHRGHRLRVTPYNFTSNHHTFTVSAISDNLFFCSQVEVCGNSNKAPVVDLKSGQPTEICQLQW
ncbi:unnamed protein product [Brassica rapa subsp. narinosa]